MFPELPVATKVLFPNPTPMRVLPVGEVTGKYCGLDCSGNLLIETKNGIKSIETGEVFPVVTNYNE